MRRRELILLLGAAMTAPGVLRAQQKAMPVIGFLSSEGSGALAARLTALRQGLSEAGYVEGQNVAIEYRWAEGHYDRLPALAADLVGRKVDVIVTSGGNLTGVTCLCIELWGKRVELISELVPEARVIAHLVDPNFPSAESAIKAVQEAAREKMLQLRILKAATDSEMTAAFESLVELQAGALIVGDPFFLGRPEQVAALAARYAIPTIYDFRVYVAAGGLISYGTSLTYTYRKAGTYVGKILKGAKPADLPVQQPTTFELVVNLNTAKTLPKARRTTSM